MRKAALHNLGCKVNAYETEAMQQLLEDAGYEIVPFREGADVYVINTCSVTNVADKKSRQLLHRAKKLNPEAVVVAVGCYVQAAGEELKKDGAVDLLVGNNKKKDLIPILEAYFRKRQSAQEHQAGQQRPERPVMLPEPSVIDIGAVQEYEALSIRKIADHTRAFIKIQDGCNQFCSYCIIPYTRGRIRSRGSGEVVEEVKELAAAGYHEIVLTGIHLSSYGRDWQESEDFQGRQLLELMGQLDRIQGIERIRLGSLEPRIMTEEFVKALSELPSFCPHFHLSLQSGCDATLGRMNRRYTTEDYARRCERIRSYFQNPAITTDVITGFPQETEEEFQATCRFLEQIRFYEMHIFKYSRREGTRAAAMEGQVPEQVKAERSDLLLEMAARLSREYRESFLGKEAEILMEEKVTIDGTDYMAGHTRQYVKAAVPYRQGLRNRAIRGKLKRFLTEEILLLEER